MKTFETTISTCSPDIGLHVRFVPQPRYFRKTSSCGHTRQYFLCGPVDVSVHLDGKTFNAKGVLLRADDAMCATPHVTDISEISGADVWRGFHIAGLALNSVMQDGATVYIKDRPKALHTKAMRDLFQTRILPATEMQAEAVNAAVLDFWLHRKFSVQEQESYDKCLQLLREASGMVQSWRPIADRFIDEIYAELCDRQGGSGIELGASDFDAMKVDAAFATVLKRHLLID